MKSCRYNVFLMQNICAKLYYLVPNSRGLNLPLPIYSWEIPNFSYKINYRDMSLAFAGGSPLVTGGFPSQRASNAENVSIWWRHHECRLALERRNSSPLAIHIHPYIYAWKLHLYKTVYSVFVMCIPWIWRYILVGVCLHLWNSKTPIHSQQWNISYH